MSSPITLPEVAERLINFPLDRYLYIGSIMRGIAWAAATYVLLELLINPKKYWPRLLPWFASFLATMVTLTTWGRGVLLTNSRANVWDSVLPTLMGIVEFLLFAILAPRENSDSKRDAEPWNFWFFALGTHALLAVLLVQNRISNTDILKDFEPKLQSLATEYMQWMYADRLGATIGAILFFLFGLLMVFVARRFHVFRSWKAYGILFSVLSLIPIIIYSNVVSQAESQRQRTDEVVSGLKAASTQGDVAPR
jgi:hypothetical protein